MSDAGFSDRLVARAAALGIEVARSHSDQLRRYYELLRRWNSRMNLTALPLEEAPTTDVLDRLFMEPLIAATLVEDEPIEWLDVGSGGGSPAIPLKVVRNQLNLTMVEARARKAAFLREATRNLNLPNVEVLAERVEMLSEPMAGAVDLITIRAVRMDLDLLHVFRRLLDMDGRLMIFGTDQMPPGFEVIERAALPGGDSFVTVLGLGDPLSPVDDPNLF